MVCCRLHLLVFESQIIAFVDFSVLVRRSLRIHAHVLIEGKYFRISILGKWILERALARQTISHFCTLCGRFGAFQEGSCW
jgi:hypothetical protein